MIRQSEFQKLHKLAAAEVAELRRTHLTEQTDWHAEGRAIYWTSEAAERVAKVLASGEKHPEVAAMVTEEKSETLTVRAVKIAKNAKFVYAGIDGDRIAVYCGKHAKRVIGKNIEVRKETDSEGTTKYSLIR